MISGFVIAQLLVSELIATDGLRFGRFYGRRAKRLFPALALMLVVAAAAGILLIPVATQYIGPRTGIAASFFLANAYVFHLGTGYFDTSTSFDPFLHTWTLAVEEQFYLVFPILLLLGWQLGRLWRGRKIGVVLVIGVVTVASFASSLYLSVGGEIRGLTSSLGTPQSLGFYSSPSRAWEFGVGALLALTPLVRIPVLASRFLGVAGLTAIGVTLFAVHGTARFPGTIALLPVAGAAALLAAGGGTALSWTVTAS